MRTISLNQKGAGQIIINALNYQQVIIPYSLSIDGKIIDSKQMVLTR